MLWRASEPNGPRQIAPPNLPNIAYSARAIAEWRDRLRGNLEAAAELPADIAREVAAEAAR
jgi:hypothetical protein